MLKDMGASVRGGDMQAPEKDRSRSIILFFEEKLSSIVDTNKIPRRYIRPLAPGTLVCGALGGTYYVGYYAQPGMPACIFTNLTGHGRPNLISFHRFLQDTFAVDFCVVALEDEWIDSPDREKILGDVANALVERELSRHQNEASIMANFSIFGPNHYPVQDNLVFVLMPFDDSLTRIYNEFVKKTIESKGFVCRRADDISSNNAIIHDIWKSICEARFVLADISTLNPNVMYELGIAHTIGKETILINQSGTSSNFPFDISHIRILTYENTAIGGSEFSCKLNDLIDSVVSKLEASNLKVS